MGAKRKRRWPSVLSIRTATGRLTWAGHNLDVRFSVRVDRSGRLSLDFHKVPLTKERAWVLDIRQTQSRFATWATLAGSTADGRRITSDYVYLGTRDIGTGPRGTFVKLAATASRLRIGYADVPKTSPGLQLTYVTVGMRGFSVQSVRASVGEIRVGAPSEEPEAGELSGFVVIRAANARPLAKWIALSDQTVERVLDMVSLAEGKHISWSVRHIVRGRETLETEFYGARGSGRGHDGVGHFLNLQPFLELGVTRYTKALQKRTGLKVALSWFLFSPPEMELQLVAATTALEHLVATYVSRNGSPTILHPRTFAAVQRRVRQAFADARRAVKGQDVTKRREGIARVADKFAHVNESSFRDKLGAMLETYAVPIAGLEKAIGKAVQARNVVVHTGLFHDYGKYRELYLHVVVLRELLKRVMLTLLEYKGQYHSMLNGPEWVEFPPSGSTSIAPP